MDRKQLAAILVSLFERCLGFGQDVSLEFHDKDAIVFRLLAMDDIRRHLRGDRVGQFWEPVGRLSEMMGKKIHGAVTGTTRALDVGFAAEMAAALIRQMAAAPDFEIKVARDREFRFQTAFARFARKSAQCRGRIEKNSLALIQKMQLCLPAELRKKNGAGFRFQTTDDQLTVTPFVRNVEDQIGEPMTLQQFVDQLARTAEAGLLTREIARARQLVAESNRFGETRLPKMSTVLADALVKCNKERRLVGLPLCNSARIRNIPAHVVLYFYPAAVERPAGTVSLVLRRAHEEFVLQNSGGELLYFPPIQLVASLQVHSLKHDWTLGKPRVRMPSRQPRWLHPYTSNLDPDAIDSGALMLSEMAEPMMAISADAQRLVRRIAWVSEQALSSDFCLQEQGPRVARAEKQLRRSLAVDDEPDVLTAVRDIWDLARFGLTSAHQLNHSGPRAPLTVEVMPYPIKNSREFRQSQLARRLFPFDPAKPLPLNR